MLVLFISGYYIYSYQFLWTYLMYMKHAHTLAIAFAVVFNILYILVVTSYFRSVWELEDFFMINSFSPDLHESWRGS